MVKHENWSFCWREIYRTTLKSIDCWLATAYQAVSASFVNITIDNEMKCWPEMNLLPADDDIAATGPTIFP